MTIGTEVEQLVEHYSDIAVSLHEHKLIGWRVNYDKLHANLSDYPLDFLESIKGIIEARDLTAAEVFLQMQIGSDAYGHDYILDSLLLHKLLGTGEYLQNAALFDALVSSPHKAAFGFAHSLRENDEDAQSHLVALVRFVSEFVDRDAEEADDWIATYPDDLFEYDGRGIGRSAGFYVKDPAMVRLVMEHPDRIDEIVSVIKDREIIDPDTILAVINSGVVPALRNGAL